MLDPDFDDTGETKRKKSYSRREILEKPTQQQGTEWAGKACPKMNKNAKFGRFWAKNPFFTGEIKSFVTHITENPPRHLVHIGFGRALDKMCKKMAIFGPKWPKMQILDQIWPFLGQKS